MNNDPNIKATALLKAIDVAEKLNISKSLAYQLMKSGEIPTIQIRKLVRVTEYDLEEYILKSKAIRYV